MGSHRHLPRWRNHHRLRATADELPSRTPEVLDNDPRLLVERVWLRGDESNDLARRPATFDLGVLLERRRNLPEHLERHEALQHVEDEFLLDRLTHRIRVERTELPA